MKQASENRFTKPLQEWKESQQRLSSIFSSSILKSKAFEKEELIFRQNLLMHIGKPKNLEERITRKLLQQQKRELEKSLFPNLLIRLIRLAMEFSKDQYRRIRMEGQKTNSIPNRRVSIRSGPALDRLTATHSKNSTLVKQRFIGQDKFSQAEQKNLMEGRSVAKKDLWFHLDLADMDTKGRFALKQIPFKFDLETKLLKLPFELQSETAERLRQGERVEAKIQTNSVDRTIFVEANPIMRNLIFYDDQQKRMTLKQLMGLQDLPTMSIGRQKKKGLSAV